MSKIMVSLPAYNEEKYIGSLLDQIKTHYEKILIVDDGSADRTATIALEKGCRLITHSTNQGYGATIQTILSEFLKTDNEILVILDADNQHDPNDIGKMVNAIEKGADLAIGYRDKNSIPQYRKLGQGIISFFVRFLSGSKVRDTQSGFRAFSRKAVEKLKLKQNGMAVSSEMLNCATKNKLKIVEVPISVRYLNDSSTHNPVMQGVGTMAKIITMISERKPLTFFGVSGIIELIGGFLLGVKSYYMLEANEILPIGTVLGAVLLIMMGVLSLFTGIILRALSNKLDK
jgi:glycosyltransferase involved in cell wall biosynthesis